MAILHLQGGHGGKVCTSGLGWLWFLSTSWLTWELVEMVHAGGLCLHQLARAGHCVDGLQLSWPLLDPPGRQGNPSGAACASCLLSGHPLSALVSLGALLSLGRAGLGWAEPLWPLSCFGFSGPFSSPSLNSRFALSVFPPLVVCLFHFSLISTPAERRQRGASQWGALGISHSVPIVVNGNLVPRPFILVSSTNTAKNLWILRCQYPA